MMSNLTYSKSNRVNQLNQLNHLASARHWLIEKLQEFRDKKALNQQIKLLKSLDYHILEDMGIDIGALYSAHPRIKRTETPERYYHLKSLMRPTFFVRLR
jgi:hypothetical protein